MPPLSDTQEKVLALLPIGPSIASLSSSLTILLVVYQHYHAKRQTTVYHRLLVAMSLCDMFVSFWIPWSHFLVPAETSTRLWAIGNTDTCAFIGFVNTFCIVTGLLYNAMLSFYFLLTARFGWRDSEIARCLEKPAHFVVVVYPLTCGLTLASLGVYAEQPIGGGCWVGDYPHGCGEEDGNEPCITILLGWITAGGPVMMGFASVVVNNLVIYCFVRSTVKRSQRYSMASSTNRSSSTRNLSSSEHGSLSDRGSSSRRTGHLLTSLKRSSSRLLQSSTTRRNNHNTQDSQTRRLQSVGVQAALYCCFFFLTYAWVAWVRIMAGQPRYWTDEHESELFVPLVLQAFFLPLQGCLNLIAFSRPKYLTTRQAFPHQSRLWCFRRAMFGDLVKERSSQQQQPRLPKAAAIASSSKSSGGSPKAESSPQAARSAFHHTTATLEDSEKFQNEDGARSSKSSSEEDMDSFLFGDLDPPPSSPRRQDRDESTTRRESTSIREAGDEGVMELGGIIPEELEEESEEKEEVDEYIDNGAGEMDEDTLEEFCDDEQGEGQITDHRIYM